MKKSWCSFLCLAVAASLLQAQNAPPGPASEMISEKTIAAPSVQGAPGFRCAFAPDYVGSDIPRRFFVEFDLSALDDPAPRLTYDQSKVRLLGQRALTTAFLPNGRKAAKPRNVRRFYFETVAGVSGRVDIGFADAKGSVTVPVTIWNYADLRRPRVVNGVSLPRRYPVNGRIERLKPPVPRPRLGKDMPRPFAPQHRANNKDKYSAADYTLDELWALAPDAGLSPRQQVAEPDPVHGTKVFNAGGAFYPYKQLVGAPGHVDEWYIINPVDGRRMPDNDLAKGDYTSGKMIDDGFNGMEVDGKRYHVIAQLNWFRGSNAYDMAFGMADNFRRTGDFRYLTKALVMLSRLAVEHNYLATMQHHRKTHFNLDWQMRLVDAVPMTRLGNCGFYNHGCAQPSMNAKALQAYNLVFPFLADDKEIIPYLRKKGFPVNNTADLQRFIEENLVHTSIQITLDGTCNTNYPGPQKIFLQMVDTLKYPDPELMDIVIKGDGTYFINGIISPVLYSAFCRDGVNAESPGGYNGGALPTAAALIRQFQKIVKENPKAFPPEQYLALGSSPKLALGMESMIEHQPIAATRLTLGDAGNMPVFSVTPPNKRHFYGDANAAAFADVYTMYPNAKIAWALVNSGWKPTKDYPYSLEQLQKHAATLLADWRLRSRLLPGLGIALNRSGKGDFERCLITVYGNVYGGHANDSTMGLFLDGFGSRLITQWGYPQNWDSWYRCWVTQNTGRHYPTTPAGRLEQRSEVVDLMGSNELQFDAGPLHVTDSFAELVRDKYVESGRKNMIAPRYEVLPDGWQRRINLLVDASDRDFYVLDLYRIFGGKEHWRSFQTLDGAVTTEKLAWKKQPKGTLAGEDIAYDQKSWWGKGGNYGLNMLRPLTLLDNVETAVAPAAPWSIVWDINNSAGLKMKLTGLRSENAELNLADGRDPRNAHNVVRRFLMTHHRSPDGKPFHSETLNLIEAYRGAPVVRSARELPVVGKDERGHRPAGIEVKLANRTDYFIIGADDSPKRMTLPNGKIMELSGRIGYVALDRSGKVADMRLIAGTRLAYAERTLTHPVGVYRGEIVKTDYAGYSFDVSPAAADPAEWVGKQLYVLRGGQKIGLEVQSAVNDGDVTRVKVNCDPLLFLGTSRKFADNYLGYRDHLNLGPSWANDVAALSSRRTYFEGTVIGRTGTRYLVNSVGAGGINLMPGQSTPTDAATLAREFPVGSTMGVYDYGVGNRVEVPLCAGLAAK